MSDDRPRMVAYDVPLRPGELIRKTLPLDLTAADAERIARFVRTLVFDPDDNEVEAS